MSSVILAKIDSLVMDTLPKIVIITAVYNGARYLPATFESVREVKPAGVHYIVIDGGSTDGTKELLQSNADIIDHWISEKDKGIYDAFNKGWQAAPPNSFLLYLGAGDRIISLPSFASFSNADVVYGKVDIEKRGIFKSMVGFKLKLGNTIHHQALLLRKEIFSSPPFDLRFHMYADFDVNQRLLKTNARFVYDDAFLGYAMTGGITHTFNARESTEVVRKNYGLIYAGLARLYYFAQGLKAANFLL